MWTIDRTLYYTKALFRNSFVVVGQPCKSSSDSNLHRILSSSALNSPYMHSLSFFIKWCGDLETHRTVNDFLKPFYLVKDKICYLEFLVTDIKYIHCIYNTVEEETVPRKINILIYIFLHHLYWLMDEVSQHLLSSVFLLLTVSHCNLLPSLFFCWSDRGVHHTLWTGNLQLWLQVGIGVLCFSPVVQMSLQFR